MTTARELVQLALVGIINALLEALFVKLFWNIVVPSVFDLPVITYWQAFALYALASSLFNWNAKKQDA